MGVDIWTTVDLDVGIVCACIPTMRRVITRTIFRPSPPERQAEAEDETGNIGTSGPRFTLNHKMSIASQSVHYAHRGVLGDTI